MTTTVRNFIDGELRDAASGATAPLIDPVTGQEFASAALSGSEDVDDAMRAAERAFDTWRETTPSERGRALLRIADAVEDHAEELARLEVENTGKPFRAHPR